MGVVGVEVVLEEVVNLDVHWPDLQFIRDLYPLILHPAQIIINDNLIYEVVIFILFISLTLQPFIKQEP